MGFKTQIRELKNSVHSWELKFEEMQAKYETSTADHGKKILKMGQRLKTIKSRLKLGNQKMRTMEAKLIVFSNNNTIPIKEESTMMMTDDRLKMRKPKKKKKKSALVIENQDTHDKNQPPLVNNTSSIPDQTDHESSSKLKDREEAAQQAALIKRINKRKLVVVLERIEIPPHKFYQLKVDDPQPDSGPNSNSQEPVEEMMELSGQDNTQSYDNDNGTLKTQEQDKRHKPRPCNECGRVFYKKKALRRHFETHLDEQISQNIKRDEDNKQVEEGVQCLKCNRKLNGINAKHLCEQKFTCLQCHRKFSRNDRLQEHVKTHTGKIHHCHSCKMTFGRRDNLKRHQKQQHGPCKRSKLACVPCQISFCGNIQRHYQSKKHRKAVSFIIDSHECPVCARQFTSASAVYVHLRGHTTKQDY